MQITDDCGGIVGVTAKNYNTLKEDYAKLRYALNDILSVHQAYIPGEWQVAVDIRLKNIEHIAEQALKETKESE